MLSPFRLCLEGPIGNVIVDDEAQSLDSVRCIPLLCFVRFLMGSTSHNELSMLLRAPDAYLS